MDRDHFAYTGIMIEDGGSGIGGRVEVADAGFGSADELRIAENDERPLAVIHESIPESVHVAADLVRSGCGRRALFHEQERANPQRRRK